MIGDVTAMVTAVADAVEAIAQPNPDVVAARLAHKDKGRRLRMLSMVRHVAGRVAALEARGGKVRVWRVAKLKAKLKALEAALEALNES